MRYLIRFILWMGMALVSLGADIATKSAPHSLVVYNYSHTPGLVFIVVGLFLGVLALVHSNLIAIGSGLMLGGLAGNAGQLLLLGYATDWIPVAGWFTNLADVSGALGLLCCCVGYGSAFVCRRPAGS